MTSGLYVYGEYGERLQTLFQQNKVNVSFRETVPLIARNPFLSSLVEPDKVSCSGTHHNYSGESRTSKNISYK